MRNPTNLVNADPDGWTARVLQARESVHAATTLEELAMALNGPDFAALPLQELVNLPTFGGARPGGRCVFSWDRDRVLVMNDLGDGFTIEPRGR